MPGRRPSHPSVAVFFCVPLPADFLASAPPPGMPSGFMTKKLILWDIACGKVIGARTIAVATGRHAVAELAAHAPDAVLADFSDPDAFLRIIDA